jgi:DNA-binding transcriptional ArsR family regulator
VSAHVNSALRLIGALDDPLRLAIVRRLMAGGATVSELVADTGAAQSKVSNHLGLLRDAEVVVAERMGRHITYTLANPALAGVIEAIEAASGVEPPAELNTIAPIAIARSCYDHVAGRLGVALFESLVARSALRPVAERPDARKVRSALGDVALGRNAARTFESLDIAIEQVASERRRFATACNDWTESRPHLGGALGAALQQRFLSLRWLQRRGGTRALRITPAGRAAFAERFAIDIEQLSAVAR